MWTFIQQKKIKFKQQIFLAVLKEKQRDRLRNGLETCNS